MFIMAKALQVDGQIYDPFCESFKHQRNVLKYAMYL